MRRGRQTKRECWGVWKNDRCIAVGTMQELAEKFGVKISTVKFWASPSGRKRAEGYHPRGIKYAERIY